MFLYEYILDAFDFLYIWIDVCSFWLTLYTTCNASESVFLLAVFLFLLIPSNKRFEEFLSSANLFADPSGKKYSILWPLDE